METSFVDQFTGGDLMDGLIPRNRREFYNRLKELVVMLRVVYISQTLDGTRRGNRQGQQYVLEGEMADDDKRRKTTRGGGVIINQDGCILTCSHVIPESYEAIMFCFEHARGGDANDYHEALLVSRSVTSDLALLQPVEPFAVNYAMLSQEMVEVGMEVFSIFHPNSLNYTYACGQICYPNYRLTREVLEHDELTDLAQGLRVIQINNLHGGKGGSGAPVFDSHGRVVGIFAFMSKNLDYAIHVETIKAFWKQSQKLRIKVKEDIKRRRGGGDSSSRPTKSLRKGSSSTERGTRGTTAYGPSTTQGKIVAVDNEYDEDARLQKLDGELSYFNEPAYDPVPPSEPSEDWQQMGAYDPMQGQALAGGYQGEWLDYQFADHLAYPEQYLQQNVENYDVQTGLNIQQDPRLMAQKEKVRGLGSVFKHDDQRLQQVRERDSREKDRSFISDSYSECYPGYEEFNREIVDSDDEADLPTMDMGVQVPVSKTNWIVNSSRKLLKRWHI